MSHTLLIMFIALILSACSVFESAGAAEEGDLPAVVKDPASILVEGHLAPRDHASLFFTLSGEVVEVLVQEGDRVTKGQVLASLGDREALEARLASAQLERVSAQQAFDDLQTSASLASGQALMELASAQEDNISAQEAYAEIDTQDTQDDLDDARAKVADAEKKLEDAQEEFDKYQDLGTDHPNRKRAEDDLETAQDEYDQAVWDRDRLINSLDQAYAALQTAKARLDEAQRTADARKEGPDPDDLAVAQARLDNAQAQVTAAEAELKKLDLTAPFDGTIVQVEISLGERAIPNQPVMVLADFSTWYVETSDLTENEVVYLEAGQTARIVPDVLPELELSATIETISQAFVERSGDINYETRLVLADPDPRLRWGMTVEVRFDNLTP
jgi:multidrug resistance efflux pump